VLNSTIQTADKFEAILAVDQVMAILRTFSDSQQMAAQNLINFYLNDELADLIPDILLQSIFSLLLTHDKPFKDLPPLYFAMLVNNLVNLS